MSLLQATSSSQGVASFVYNPRDCSEPQLLQLSRPLDELEAALLKEFAGRRLTMRQIYESHSVGTPYLSGNYKEALARLEAKVAVRTNPSLDQRRRGTFADHVQVTFPTR
jgi:hypothetical protein